MPRSDLSGEEFEEGKAARVTVTLEDGTTRELRTSDEEAREFVAKGREASPWYVHLARRIARPGTWVLGIAVTSLLIPAVTKQWSDRPKEVELRISLVDQVAQLAASTINTARFIVADTLPEATLRVYRCDRADETGLPVHDDLCEEQKEEEFKAEQEAHVEAKTAWIQRGAVLESQLIAYFPGTELAREGKRYVDAVRIYLFLASGVCGEKREIATNKVLGYLGEDRQAEEWAPLYDLSETECEEKSENLEFRGVYGPLGDRMLAERLDLLLLLNEADAVGFSSGLGDFISDALPALILFALGALYVAWYAWAVHRDAGRPGGRPTR